MDAAGRAEHLKRIERDETATERLNIALWVVVVGVSIYGLFIVEPFLRKHGIPDGTAWMLPTAVDAAFIISIRATGLLARHGVTAPWVTLLRWVSGLMALGLALAPTLATTPIKGGDVITHGFGPALLFFGVEGLAQFQVRMGAKLRAQREAVAVADLQRQDLTEALRLAERAAAEALRDASAARTEATNLAEQLATERASGGATATAMEALRTEHAATVEALRADHTEALRRAAEDKAEALRTLRAKLTTVDLTERRRATTTSTGGVPKPPPEAPTEAPSKTTTRTDDECLRAMADTTTDPLHEWTPTAAQKAASVGFERAKRLVEAWPQWASANLPQTTTAAAN